MQRSRRMLAAVLTLVGLCLLPALAGAAFKCSSCHRGLAPGPVNHKPVADNECLRCHQQNSDDHPLNKDAMTFVVPRQKLCAHCHSTLVQKKVLHKPVGEGNCTQCHMHHFAENKSLLKDPQPTLCFRCHPKEKFTGHQFGHPPVAKGECLSCHDAHQSDGRYLLRKPGQDFCYMCHNQKMFKGRSVHKPVGLGQCGGCHIVHGSNYRKILRADAPTVLYKPFDVDAFPLCFTCHNPKLVQDATTEKATAFRNGDRNLHTVHVGKSGKGRACKMCHDPHASEQDRLIYPKAPGFGVWDIPIRYKSTPTGGTCSVGCHKTFSYDRVKAVAN